MLISVSVAVRTVCWGLAAYCTCLLVVVIYRLVNAVLYHRKVNRELLEQKVPQPCEQHWIAGNVKEIFLDNGHRRMDFWCEAFKKSGAKTMAMCRVCFDPNPVELITADPAVVKYMLKDNVNNFLKTQPNSTEGLVWGFKDFLGDGIFAVSHGPKDAMDQGKTWHQQRKIISKMFTTNEFKNFIFGSFAEKADILVEVLQKQQGPIDLQDMLFKYTMDSFGQIAFNASFNTMQSSFILFKRIHCFALSCSLWRRNTQYDAWWNGTVHKIMLQTIAPLKRFKGHMNVLKKYTTKVIQDRRECSSEETTATDILGLFLKAASEEGGKIDHQYLTDVVLNLILAGRDTTACLLSWTFYELCMNPAVMGILRQELQTADPNDFKSMKSMPYLQAAFYEGGRLHPPVPIDGKVVQEDDVLPDGTIIRASCMTLHLNLHRAPALRHPDRGGWQIAYSPYMMGRDPDLWEEPEAFRPERWLDEEGAFVQPNPYKYPVFQAGPRVCLGMNFAIMEASVCATKLIQNFDFELATGSERLMPDCQKLTMSIREGLYMKITPRAK